jgi:hypothetical protein
MDILQRFTIMVTGAFQAVIVRIERQLQKQQGKEGRIYNAPHYICSGYRPAKP